MRIWFARVRRMSKADYGTAVEVVRHAVWIECALTLMPFSRLLRRVNHQTSHAASASITPAEYQRLGRFVAVAYDILPLPASCLRQSLVLRALLARRRVPSRVCLGVRKNEDALDAHAWVECDGVLSEDASGQFSELAPAAKELPDVVHEELRLLHRGEVPAAGHVRQLL